ncbi:hypothetical protein [Parvularcula lutaonensis]|uniref:Uncharacterized protein n=1 Tax=Parvularcula lutaonensis TaxID=491923 RepID=A0ABV7MD85_9PROT|nr:hypothetical protein [Parvularcula lutaonensis]
MANLSFHVAFSKEPTGDIETYWDELPDGAELRVTNDDGVWLSGNREGLLLLSTKLAEIALRDLEPGWHSHIQKLEKSDLDFTVEKLAD